MFVFLLHNIILSKSFMVIVFIYFLRVPILRYYHNFYKYLNIDLVLIRQNYN